ncbi:radical SAM protein [Bifidobacterium aquikefiricola]|uniref:Radical SAM protein n=1 Tax=Bifidobacterium aquikefiricola TaxID=3059038 RepID=A0AB39U5G5_9BIFI
MTPYIFNVQHFSTHDGPGVRTTVFFKGCPIRCAWCHNPESQSFRPETMTNEDGSTEYIGAQYRVDELIHDLAKDEIIYDQSGGGVTLSGGEVLAQDRTYVFELLEGLREREISIGIDTCGVASPRIVEESAAYADFYLYDVKFIDDSMHRKYTRGSNRLVLQNLETLTRLNARIMLRLIILPGLNSDESVIESTMLWLKTHHIAIEQVDILPYHTYGMNKYARLGRKAVPFTVPSDELIERIKRQIEDFYQNVTIGG